MKTFRIIGVVLGAVAFAGLGCKHNTLIDLTDPTVTINCDPDTVYFQNDVLPLLVSNCAKSGCHESGGGHEEEANPLSSYNEVMASDYVDPFNANHSKLIEVLTESGEDKMPPSPNEPLTASQRSLLEKWINQGARNNACEGGDCDTTVVNYSNQIVRTINTYCKGCHSGASPSGGIDLSSYSGAAAIAANGSFLGSVQFDGGYVAMPYNGTMLSDCKIAEIRIWIENGYPND